jgi:hypothetical protein
MIVEPPIHSAVHVHQAIKIYTHLSGDDKLLLDINNSVSIVRRSAFISI